MSKAHDPHWRYIAFRLHGETPVSRRALSNSLRGRFRKLDWPDEELPNLTRFEWPHAIIKIHHFHLEAARKELPKMDWAIEAAAKVPFRVETLSSSGTIKALTTRLGILQQRGADKPKGAGTQKVRANRGPAPPPGARR